MSASQLDAPLANGHDGHVHPPPATAKKTKGKKGMDSNEASRLLQARISQLEQDAAGEKDQELEIEREVKRANRDLLQQVSKMDNMQKIDHLTKRSSELLADMRRLERENQKNKRRGDNLQKERDTNRTELSKTVGLKEKLEKLCRELQRDNNKMKVPGPLQVLYRTIRITRAAFPLPDANEGTRGPIPYGPVRAREEECRGRVNEGPAPTSASPGLHQDGDGAEESTQRLRRQV
ncbi:hypothetical protein AUP68_14524 [Ilyonectria robusta]